MLKQQFILYLKFKYNWTPCSLSVQLFPYTFHDSPLFLRKGSSSLEVTGTFIICPPTDLSKLSVSGQARHCHCVSQASSLCLSCFVSLECPCLPEKPHASGRDHGLCPSLYSWDLVGI